MRKHKRATIFATLACAILLFGYLPAVLAISPHYSVYLPIVIKQVPPTPTSTPTNTPTPTPTPSPTPTPTIPPTPILTTGSLTVYCNLLLGNIYLDDVMMGYVQGSYGATYDEIEAGIHTVKIVSSGWGTWSKQVEIGAGEETIIYGYLALGEENAAPSRNEIITPDSAASYGSLTVYCNLLLGNIYVGGEPGGPPQGSYGTTIKGLLPGTYTVKITESGWIDWTGQVTINSGQTTTINVTLVQQLY